MCMCVHKKIISVVIPQIPYIFVFDTRYLIGLGLGMPSLFHLGSLDQIKVPVFTR